MKKYICEIDMNETTGRQLIYWDTDDHDLHSDAEPEAETSYLCETIEQARETARSLWGWPGSPWHLEWTDEQGNPA